MMEFYIITTGIGIMAVITCHRCGEPFEKERGICPFCKQYLKAATAKTVGYSIVNLEKGMPTVEEARLTLAGVLRNAVGEGTRLIKIIHGYGSSGRGGRLQKGLRKSLAARKKEGLITAWIPGESFAGTNAQIQPVLAQFPRLKKDPDFNKNNPGITIIVLP